MNPHHPQLGDRPEITHDFIDPLRSTALSTVLERELPPGAGDPLPELWHWIFFWSLTRQTAVAADGHPHTSNDLADPSLPRRMWAGGRLRFHAPLIIGQAVSRSSQITGVEPKIGRRGRLAFVTIRHVLNCAGRVALEEEQDIVHLERHDPDSEPRPSLPQPAPEHCAWQRTIRPTETLLFRYSALSFNSHRIHYDHPYATQVEGYPDLLIHGPLLATLLMDLLHRNRPHATVREFTFKAIRPTFLGHPFTVCAQPSADGRQVDLWAKDHEGWLTMTAIALLA